MPATVRDILLMIRARDDASRALNNVSGSMRKAAAAADAASARARAAALRAQALQAKAVGATKAQIASLNASAKAYDDQARAIEKSEKKTGQLANRLQSASHLMMTTGTVLAAAGAIGVAGLKQTVDVASEWDKQVRLTFTQVDKRYKPTLEELGDIGLRVSKKVAVPFEQIQSALFDVFSSTEANMPQAEKLLEAFAKAAVTGQTDIQTASRATIGLMNTFKIPFEDVNKVLDIQFQLVQEGVGTYEEWAGKIGNVTPSAARAGQSIETMGAALATATRQGMTAARASTSVARAFDAMSNPKTEENLKKIGVATRDAKGNFRPMVDVLADWRKQLEKMPKEDRVKNIIETLKGAGGTIEARRFLQNILLTNGGLELFQDQIKEFSTDKGAFQRGYNEMADSVSAKSQLLHNMWMQLKLSIGQALMPAFSLLLDGLKKLLEWWDKLPQPVKNFIAQAALVVALFTGLAGVITVVVGALVALAAAVATAGTAILPVIAVIAAVTAGIALLTAGVALVGAAFVIAYQKSEPFRKLMQSIGEIFTFLWDQVKNFATIFWTNFQTYVLPPLRELWNQIETNVIPIIQEMVDVFKAHLEPALKTAADIWDKQLKSAFEKVAAVIRDQIIPMLHDLKTWWDQNKDAILPLVAAAGMLIGVLAILAGSALAGLIKAIASTVGSIANFVRMVIWAFNQVKSHVLNQVARVQVAIRILINLFKQIGSSAQNAMNTAKAAFSAGIAKIKGAFAGAGTWLVQAGRDIINGLVNGIKSKIGAAADAARSAASAALGAAKGLLGIHSPSKAFEDIGINIIRGLINGVKNGSTLKQLQNAMYKVIDAVMKSIREADIKTAQKRKMADKWSVKLTNTLRQLSALENKRITLQNKLAAAQKRVNDLIKERADLVEKVSEAVAKSADITSMTDEQQASSKTIKETLQQRLKDAQAFQKNLQNLAKRGFDKETIAQLASQGVESAGTLVATLAKGSDADLKAISKTQQEIRKLADQTGNKVAGDLYNAGIKAAQGLVKGLQSQINAITKQMTAIAQALIKAIKKELGIKSPSRVFQKIGVNTAQGYVNGYVNRMLSQQRSLNRATMFLPNSTRAAFNAPNGVAAGGGGTNIYRTYDQKITINTQEINPRKSAAELGWMLEGRLP